MARPVMANVRPHPGRYMTIHLSPAYAFGAFAIWAVIVAIQFHGSDAAAFWSDALRCFRFIAVAALLLLTPRVAFSLAAAVRRTASSWLGAFLLGAGSIVVVNTASVALLSVAGHVERPQHVLTLIAVFGIGCISSRISGRAARRRLSRSTMAPSISPTQ